MKTESKNKQAWITKGYELVAELGFDAVNIELIGRLLNKNKSSFYHYFGEFSLYLQALHQWHISRSQEFADNIDRCKNINPDLLNIALEYKHDIFFHKQLRLVRDKPLNAATLQIAFDNYEKAVINQWAKFFGLENNLPFVSTFIQFFTENLLLKATFDTFTFQWLEQYIEDLSTMFHHFKPDHND